MKVGSAEAVDREVSTGYVDLLSFPTGGVERAPVMIASGGEGPTLWLTANLHGNEVAGIPVVHRVVTEEIASRVEGTVVGVVTLNPSGLRSAGRESHYDSRDPNRLFPDFRGGVGWTTTQERVNAAVFELVEDTADALVDLHCSNVGSVPFSILDRVVQDDADDGVRSAREVAEESRRLAEAFGFTPVLGSSLERSLAEGLHRSLSGATVNAARTPAFTAELGSDYIVERDVVEGAVRGCRNVMRALGMLDDEPEEIAGVPDLDRGFPVRRTSIESPVSGLMHRCVEPGEPVAEGEAVCEITDAFGEVVHSVRAEREGWVTSFKLGMGVVEGDRVCYYAERADGDDVVEEI
ncbi:MAG: succinylglutamate desuccinylase/aspartoacylase family protein [Halobacteriales archaeon]